ncbi:MAG: hypothetical protein M3132_00405, partial [Actinomycetia bacterium]|nr:hypothetical protein [Actinomycetes bacterium]
QALQRAVQVPSALIVALNGLVVIFVVAADRYRIKLLTNDGRVEAAEADDDQPKDDDSSTLGAIHDRAPPGTDSFDTGEYL